MREKSGSGIGPIRGELKRLTGSRMRMVSMVGLMVIPLLYSGMLIGAFWDPYGKLNELPVAVVNEDRGAELNGQSLQVGGDLVGELKDSGDFKWAFTNEQDAMAGLKDHKYAMAFVIPEDFSRKAATLQDETPQPAQIEYYVDDGYNYLTGRIGSDASESLRTNVGHAVTKAYAEAVFASVGKAADGYKEAAGGAAQLADGAKEAEAGAQRLHDNLAKLAGGASQVQSGVSKLAGGAKQLADGTAALSGSGVTLADGLKQLAAGGDQLASGADQAAAAAKQVAAGAGQLAASGKTLASGAADAAAGGAQVAGGADALAAGLKQYAEAHGGLADDAAFQQLLAAAGQVAAGADALQQGTAAVAAGAKQLAAGGDSLAAGAGELQQGVGSVASGADALGAKLAEAAGGAGKLAAGAKELAGGAETLRSGLSAAQAGLLQVTDGSSQLTDGSKTLESGLTQLQDGSSELSSKLTDASKQASGLNGGDKQADMFADPIGVDEHKLADIPNYGTGMTPYFLALGLYVGVLMSTIIIPLRDAAGTVRGGWRWYLSKLMLFGPLVLLQTVLADTLLIAGLGVEVSNVPLFYAVSALIGLTFMTIVQFFVTLADNVGRFVAIVLLTLQLASSGGTYPSELLPGWLRHVGDWMPMTHAIKAIRLLLANGPADQLCRELLDLAAYAAAFVALIVALFILRARRMNGSIGTDVGTPALA